MKVHIRIRLLSETTNNHEKKMRVHLLEQSVLVEKSAKEQEPTSQSLKPSTLDLFLFSPTQNNSRGSMHKPRKPRQAQSTLEYVNRILCQLFLLNDEQKD